MALVPMQVMPESTTGLMEAGLSAVMTLTGRLAAISVASPLALAPMVTPWLSRLRAMMVMAVILAPCELSIGAALLGSPRATPLLASLLATNQTLFQ